jgi:hypothetical protein
MDQYKYLVKLFKYTRYGGDEETIVLVKFTPPVSLFSVKYAELAKAEEPGDAGNHHYD